MLSSKSAGDQKSQSSLQNRNLKNRFDDLQSVCSPPMSRCGNTYSFLSELDPGLTRSIAPDYFAELKWTVGGS